eukprot:c18878_g1_i1 orf=400-1056(-)
MFSANILARRMASLLVLFIASCCLLYSAPAFAQILHLSQEGYQRQSIESLLADQVSNEPDPDASKLGFLDEEEPITSLAAENEPGFTAHNGDSSISSVLDQYGLPIGLLPSCVESYTLSDDGLFSVSLEKTCYVDFDYEVYYAQTITGTLSYGTISDLSGIQAKKAFIWVSVTGMHIDPSSSSYIYFEIGPISKRLSISQFEAIPTCKAKAADFSTLG